MSSQDVSRATPSSNPPPAAPARREPAAADRAVLGPSIVVRGDIDGEEDLLVEGRVEGKIRLRNHHVTVGRRGTVQADILARTVTVEGSVEGNLQGEEQIALRPTGRVRGNLTAPRVILDDGCQLKGSIDMNGRQGASTAGRGPAA